MRWGKKKLIASTAFWQRNVISMAITFLCENAVEAI